MYGSRWESLRFMDQGVVFTAYGSSWGLQCIWIKLRVSHGWIKIGVTVL